jgi:hypothetical protein
MNISLTITFSFFCFSFQFGSCCCCCCCCCCFDDDDNNHNISKKYHKSKGLPDDASIEAAGFVESDNDRTVVIDASTAYRVDDDWAYGFPGK